MTRPSNFAPDFKARAIDLYLTSEGRTITAPYTSTGSPAPVCVDVAGRPSHSHQSVQRLEERNRLPLKIRARLTQLAEPTVGTVPGDGSGQGGIATPPQRLRHGYRRCISPLRPWPRDLGAWSRGVSEELWTPNRRRNARLGPFAAGEPKNRRRLETPETL